MSLFLEFRGSQVRNPPQMKKLKAKIFVQMLEDRGMRDLQSLRY
jgi:hypothetical protein